MSVGGPEPDSSWQPLFDVDAEFPDAWLYRSCPFAAASLTQPTT
jgi:hypothetical protein